MTAVQPIPTAARPRTDGADTPAQASVRRVVRADVALAAVSAAGLLGAARPLADLADLRTTGPLLAFGGFFAVLALGLLALGAAPARTLVRLTPVSGAGDVAWAAASVVVALVADLSGAGRAVVLVQAIVVLAMGEAKIALARRAR